ncbi:hypothetical protein ABZ953_39090 [Streptomyces sp. NPDC046465]|uniref:hypothetical protein n=1 Tax=Streptomyces sp. NPDC046465 TaxID=3155810 RepID=UPI0033F6FFD4
MNDAPDIEIFGTVYKLTVQTDRQGAVLVAYTRDENGSIGRSWIRLDQTAVDYVKRRLDEQPPQSP